MIRTKYCGTAAKAGGNGEDKHHPTVKGVSCLLTNLFSLFKPSLNWLLIFLPLAAYHEFVSHHHTWTFICSC